MFLQNKMTQQVHQYEFISFQNTTVKVLEKQNTMICFYDMVCDYDTAWNLQKM